MDEFTREFFKTFVWIVGYTVAGLIAMGVLFKLVGVC